MKLKIDLKTGELIEEAFGNRKVLMNFKTDLKNVEITDLRLAGGNMGYMFYVIHNNGKATHLITFSNPVYIDPLQEVLDKLRK